MSTTVEANTTQKEKSLDDLRRDNAAYVKALRTIANWHYSTAAKDVARRTLEETGLSAAPDKESDR